LEIQGLVSNFGPDAKFVIFFRLPLTNPSMKILAIIPARYASSRFPGKVLADIGGKSMLERVYQQVAQVRGLSGLLIATDNPLVVSHAENFGARVVLTSPDHPSGTDRCFEAMRLWGETADFVLNIQGDEPFIDPLQIETLIQALSPATQLATLIGKVTDVSQLTDPREAKVVLNTQGEALYFSRSPIPFVRDVPMEKWLEKATFYRHIGLYAYRTDVLEAITKLPPSSLEKAESLEQLRWIEHGYHIQTAFTARESLCIESPEDLQKALEWLQTRGA
jgi:3-deoxy-manno-octulosonate cytidylyltransferase (CMP-KDO synthetase)